MGEIRKDYVIDREVIINPITKKKHKQQKMSVLSWKRIND